MAELVYDETGRLLFTEEMRKEYKILIPMMLPIHFDLLANIFTKYGYNVEVLKTTGKNIVDEGLKNVHNDTCYPALLVIGQLIDAIKSGKYDVNKIALMISQTGGGCRASNYIHLLRKALKKNNLEHIPVVSLNVSSMEKNPGFKLTPSLSADLAVAVCYGDMLMSLANQTRPYEINKGETENLIRYYIKELCENGLSFAKYKKYLRKIAQDFAAIPANRVPKVKVGIVGEIYVKYAPLGNNSLENFLYNEDVEVIVPGLLDFLMFMSDHHAADTRSFNINKKKGYLSAIAESLMKRLQRMQIRAVKGTCFTPQCEFEHKKSLIAGYVGESNKMGEGWLLTAEMLELIDSGVENIICTQPFGCLPNHIVGKGMIRKIRTEHENANIVAIDYDPGATRVNQENRIRLMLAIAKKRLNKDMPPPSKQDYKLPKQVGEQIDNEEQMGALIQN